MNIEQLLNMEPVDLVDWLVTEFTVDLPKTIKDSDDVKKAIELNLQLVAYESYLNQLLSDAEIYTRNAKRNGPKIEYEDMVDRRFAITNMRDTVKHQREALSRSFTYYKNVLDETKLI